MAVVGLVLLRVTVGWHFLYQGVWKLQHPEFSSEPFLRQAKGPFAERYYSLIPDVDGRERLNEKRYFELWDQHVSKVLKDGDLSDAQRSEARLLADARRRQAEDVFAANGEEIETYLHEVDRLAKDRAKANDRDLPYERKRLWDRQQALWKQAKGWLGQLDKIEDDLWADLRSVVPAEELAHLPLPLGASESDSMDHWITLSNVAVGACLILGLLTRFAALGGAAFLLTIVLARPEWPTIYPAAPPADGRSLIVTKEFVEMMALVALAMVPVGRWGGLDFFIHHLFVEKLLGKRKVS